MLPPHLLAHHRDAGALQRARAPPRRCARPCGRSPRRAASGTSTRRPPGAPSSRSARGAGLLHALHQVGHRGGGELPRAPASRARSRARAGATCARPATRAAGSWRRIATHEPSPTAPRRSSPRATAGCATGTIVAPAVMRGLRKIRSRLLTGWKSARARPAASPPSRAPGSRPGTSASWKRSEELLLDLAIEVDDHVAAEDERAAPPGGGSEIRSRRTKLHAAGGPRRRAGRAGRARTSARAAPAASRRATAPGTPPRAPPPGCPGRCRVPRMLEAAQLARAALPLGPLAQQDGEGVRLLAARAPRAPDPAAARRRLEEARDHLALDDAPDFGVPEELGDVDRERVQQPLVLRRVVVQEPRVAGEATPGRARASAPQMRRRRHFSLYHAAVEPPLPLRSCPSAPTAPPLRPSSRRGERLLARAPGWCARSPFSGFSSSARRQRPHGLLALRPACSGCCRA